MKIEALTSTFVLVLCSFLSFENVATASPNPIASHITNMKEITLNSGVNDVHFAGVSQDVKIISSWHNNGNAHSNQIFMVIIQDNSFFEGAWSIVRFFDHGNLDSAPSTTIEDNPLAGEDYGKSVRFFNADIDGAENTLLFVSERDPNQCCSYYAPAKVHISIYQFELSPDTDVSDMYSFILYKDFWTKQKYCNSDNALWNEFLVPLPTDYEGINSETGC